MKGLFDTVRFDPPELPEPEGFTDVETRALKALLPRPPEEPIIELARATLGEPTRWLPDNGSPIWRSLEKKGLVIWWTDHWRLLDEDATRRALAVDVLQETRSEGTLFREGKFKVSLSIKRFELTPEQAKTILNVEELP